MRKFLTIIGILAFMGFVQAQTPGEGFDVSHYEIHLNNIDFDNHTLQGETFVTLTTTAATNTFVLELKRLAVNSVSGIGCDVYDFGHNPDNDLVTIVTSQTISEGTTLTFDIEYYGNTFNESWGGIMWTPGYVCNMGVGFESVPHNLGKCWFPCVDNFTDKATYDVYVTVPTAQSAVCGGLLVSDTDHPDGTHTVHYTVPQEIATYHISFVAGDYVEWTDTYQGVERDIPITVYVKPAQINSVPGTFVNVKDIAAFYEEHFGPYPFNRIGYAITSVGCMEHIDNIGITSGVLTGNTTQESYVAHEMSHMWFGNKVTCARAEEMWLNEGFAQFCGIFYRAGVYGEDDFQGAMSDLINNIASWCKSEAHWIPLNNIPQDMTYDGSAVYDRGAVIVNTLMNYLGRENFLTGIRHYLETHAFGAATSEELRDALTEATGVDMNGFFDNYVFIGGMPHYGVNLLSVSPNGDQYDARIQMTYWHVGPSHMGMNNRVEVTFVGAQGQRQTVMACWDGMEGENAFVLDFEPVAAFVDYYNHFLDAKSDKNGVFTASGSLTQGKFKALVNSVTDSTLLRIEDHFVGPDDDPGYPGITLSTSHYWNFFRNDYGDADVSAQISYSNSLNQDGDIIHTENDSAILLYRPHAYEQWYSFPEYALEGNWKVGRFTLEQAPSGQYTIAVIDKTQLGMAERPVATLRVYPNPTEGLLTVETEPADYRITSLTGQTLLQGWTEGQVDVTGLPAGTYFIIINGTVQRFIIQ